MSYYGQQPVGPPPPQGYPPPAGYPPAGYPPAPAGYTGYPAPYPPAPQYVQAPPKKQKNNTGLLQGCLAALCFCCVLDACLD